MLIIALWVVGYLLLSGAVNLYAAFHTMHSSKLRRRLLFEGGISLIAAVLLLGGSMLVAQLIILLVGVTAIAAGVSLISYALVARKAGSVWRSEVVAERV